MANNLPAMWPVAMLKQVNSLPRPKRQLTIRDRDRQAYGHHRGFDMRWHIVRSLVGMGQIGHARVRGGWNQPLEKRRQIRLNLRIGVLLDQQTGRRMPDEQRQHPGTLNRPSHLVSEFVQSLAVCLDGNSGLHG